MKSKILSATLAMLVAASPVVAGEEPFGMGFDGWKFTQEDRKEGILCRAILGQNIIARFTDGKMYVSMPAGKVPAGSYPETHLDIGGTSEPVDAKSDGKRFWLNSDAGLLDKLATARGSAEGIAKLHRSKWRGQTPGPRRFCAIAAGSKRRHRLDRNARGCST